MHLDAAVVVLMLVIGVGALIFSVLWLVMFVLGSIFRGLASVFGIRPRASRRGRTRCPTCGREDARLPNFCAQCGCALSPPPRGVLDERI